ncbi:MAG: benzoyl-CoA-dihydrodiol lyase, partial [Deltaproteobacteria bacterium]|nr:benzoyl-CoA-dihydrodiol lyase [Deltaproteobacteria bacterium]
MAEADAASSLSSFSLETHPDRYHHWKLSIDGDVATLCMKVDEAHPLRPGYVLKLNSYDLAVDIELADAVQRLRFEHPEVRAVVVTAATDRVFCAGANIPMLASSTHAFKVNFCKYTNETRLSIEDASSESGQRYLAACNGTTAGGGYELALACDDILLVDDGNSAVSLPEVPLLGVLPGTGGLTRVVDKRKVRRDRADVFCTTAEGIKGKRAVEWRLVDAVAPKSRFAAVTTERAKALASRPTKHARRGPGVTLEPIAPTVDGDVVRYRFVELSVDRAARVATLLVRGPEPKAVPRTAAEIEAAGSTQWSLRAFRELDDAILRARFHYPEAGLVVLRTEGDLEAVRATDEALAKAREESWLAHEIVLHMARVLRRVDQTARSFFAQVDRGSAFAGSLLELALAADRIYMLRDDDGTVKVALSALEHGALPMAHGPTRLAVRFAGEPARLEALVGRSEALETEEADRAGLVTAAPDEIDWEDEIRVAIEERVSMSPDALTGMEASLRFPGAERA